MYMEHMNSIYLSMVKTTSPIVPLPFIVNLHLCYCFENATPQGKNIHIVCETGSKTAVKPDDHT